MHAIYNVLLWASYQLGEFSQVYPVARGTAPWVVAVIEIALGHQLPALQLAGIVIISAGLISLALDRGRISRSALPALGAAVATGICIAGYTVVDAFAVSTTPVPVYATWMFLLQGTAMPLIALVRRGRSLFRQSRSTLLAGLGGGVVSIAAYGLVLAAQTSGATAAVAALRETSIVFGVIIGAVFLGERFGPGRALAGAVVTLGIVLINM